MTPLLLAFLAGFVASYVLAIAVVLAIIAYDRRRARKMEGV